MKGKVLLIRFNSIGDVVLTSPLIKSLSDSDYEVHYLVKSAYKNLLEYNPYISKVWTYEGKLWNLIFKLKKENYELVIDLHNNLRSNIVCLGLQKPSRRLKKYRIKNWLMCQFGFFKFQREHMVNRFMDVAKGLDIETEGLNTKYYFQSAKIYDSLSLSFDNYICLAVGTAFETKNIPYDKMLALLDELKSPVILLGGKDDKALADKLIKNCRSSEIKSYVGEISIDESAYLISKSKLLVTGDTGLMHIAAALAIPIVSIFGSTHPILGFTPYYGTKEIKHHIIQNTNLDCRPCTKQGRHSCPKGHFNCMNALSVDEISMKVESLLES